MRSHSLVNLVVFLITSPLVLTMATVASADGRFHAVTVIDRDNPVPAKWLKKAGIDYVYTGPIYTRAPLKLAEGRDGQPRLPESHHKA